MLNAEENLSTLDPLHFYDMQPKSSTYNYHEYIVASYSIGGSHIIQPAVTYDFSLNSNTRDCLSG